MDTDDLNRLRDAGVSWLRKNHSTLSADDREDVLQDALIELVRADERNTMMIFDYGALLGTIIDRRAANVIRKNRKRARVEHAAGDASDLAILSDGRGLTIGGAIFATDFDQALRGLPEDERNAFILNELRGLSVFEAATLLGVPAGTLRNRTTRARELLRKELN